MTRKMKAPVWVEPGRIEHMCMPDGLRDEQVRICPDVLWQAAWRLLPGGR